MRVEMGAEPAVMVIDDDDHLREAMSLLLEAHGYDVEECADACEALERLEQGAVPDVILLDLVMPRMDGWQFRLEQKREAKWANIPVVAISGDSSPQARAFDAQAYLIKPVDDVVLLQTIQQLVHALASARMHQHLRGSPHEALASVLAEEVDDPLSSVLRNLELAQRKAGALRPEGAQVELLVELRRVLARGQRGVERIRAVMHSATSFAPLAPTPSKPPSARPRRRRARICVVDDEPMMCELIGALLAGEYEVAAFTDPRAALNALRTRAFDVVLCDLMMPELTGMDLYERLSEERPELAQRFVFISGGAYTERTREFLTTTCLPQVRKPFHRQELIDAVESQLTLRTN
jgi:CheY-like chemotaxis protein